MIVMRNMDELMELDLPSDWIAAAHICACNPRKLAHYPKDWCALRRTSTSSLHQLTTVRQDPRELRIHPSQSPEWPFTAIVDPTVQASSLHSAELRPRRSYAFCNARTIDRSFPSHLTACPHVFFPRSRSPRSLFPRQMETTALGLQRDEDAEGHTQEPMARRRSALSSLHPPGQTVEGKGPGRRDRRRLDRARQVVVGTLRQVD